MEKRQLLHVLAMTMCPHACTCVLYYAMHYYCITQGFHGYCIGLTTTLTEAVYGCTHTGGLGG